MNIFRRILVPYDFSRHATRALEVAAELARDHGGRLLVLHAIAPFHPVTALPEASMPWVPDADMIVTERGRLEAIVARIVRGKDAPPVECKVVIGDPFHRITDEARGADSIVMATAGRTGLAHLVIGSVAEKVVRHAPVPVLTVRPAVTRAGIRKHRRNVHRTARRAARRR